MAQKGNDNQKQGVVSSYPDNVCQGVVCEGENSTPLALGALGDPNYRGPSFGNKTGYVLGSVPD